MSQKLKKLIDRMVEDSIRRVLPAIMNEVLIKTIATSGLIQERKQSFSQPVQQQRPPQKQRKLSSLNNLLDESVGADFYGSQADEQEEYQEETVTRRPDLTQRIQSLPQELRGLAEDVNLDDDGGEMWGDNEHDSSMSDLGGPSVNIEQAAKAVGLDFSRMKHAIKLTEKKNSNNADAAANRQFEEQRIKRQRERLNGGKPIE